MKAFLFSIFVLSFSGPALAGGPLKGGVMDKAPFAWEENGKRMGFHVEVAEAIANKGDYTSEVQMAPVMRIIELLRNHSVDFIILTEYKELEDIGVKKTLLLEVEASVFSMSSHPVKTKDELKEGTIARLGKGCVGLADDKGIQWLDVQSYEQAYELLKAQRVKGVCSTVAFWHMIDKKGSRKDIQVLSMSKKSVWVQVMPDIDEKKWKTIQKAVQSLIKEGTVEKLAMKYTKMPK